MVSVGATNHCSPFHPRSTRRWATGWNRARSLRPALLREPAEHWNLVQRDARECDSPRAALSNLAGGPRVGLGPDQSCVFQNVERPRRATKRDRKSVVEGKMGD